MGSQAAGFEVIIHKPSGEFLAKGDSLPGENWKSTALRLIQETAGDRVARQIESFAQWEGEKANGQWTIGVVSTHAHGNPLVEHFRVETTPPQI